MTHETHVCRDCGAQITLPYARATAPAGDDPIRHATDVVIDLIERTRNDKYEPPEVSAVRATLSVPRATAPAGLRGHVPDALVVALAERHLDDGSPCFCDDYIAGRKSPFSTLGSEHSDYCERVRAALAASGETEQER